MTAMPGSERKIREGFYLTYSKLSVAFDFVSSLLKRFYRWAWLRPCSLKQLKDSKNVTLSIHSDITNLLKKGIEGRNANIRLIHAIQALVNQDIDKLSGIARDNFLNIDHEIRTLGDFSEFIQRTVNQEIDGAHILEDRSGEGLADIISAIENWNQNIQTQRQRLIQVQRYVSSIRLKIPIETSETLAPTYEPHEIGRARDLNMEILAYESLLGEKTVTSTPPNIQVEPTNRCNARCKPCPHSSPVGKTYSDLNPDTLRKIPHVLSVAQFVELFALGEPSIAPAFGQIATLCENQGCETHMITNGSRLIQNPDLRRMKKIGISLDGDNKETFEAIRVGLNFDSLISSIKIFRTENPEIFLYFNCTINRANILQIPGMTALARELGLNAICFHRMFEVNRLIESETLKQEDLVVYQEKIEEAKTSLRGTDVLLFDYSILERMNSTEEILDPEASLTRIRSFSPKKDNYTDPISTVIKMISQDPLQLYPQHRRIKFYPKQLQKNDSSNSVEIPSMPHNQVARDIQALEKRAQSLKTKVLAAGAEGIKVPYCTAAWSRLIVKADGRMFPCSCWSTTYANLNDVQDFDTVWNGEFHQSLRDSFHGNRPLNKRCQKCPSIDRYQGLTEIIRVIKGLNIIYEDIPKQPGFNPPPGKLQL